MFKKICSFIILIIMTISLVSVFVYPVYRIKSEEILTEGSFIETLNECGYLENNDYEISNDIYLTDLMKMFVSYVKYDYDIYRTLESKTFVGKMNELFTLWINPLSLFLILLVYLILIITLFVIFIKSIFGNLTTYQPKIFLGLIESAFFVICLINIGNLIPINFINNAGNIGTKGILTMLLNSQNSNALTILFWSIVFSLWVALMQKVFSDTSLKKA